jgi:hypothetical protein
MKKVTFGLVAGRRRKNRIDAHIPHPADATPTKRRLGGSRLRCLMRVKRGRIAQMLPPSSRNLD